MQPSCPRNICTKHGKKLPNLTAFMEFSYTLRTTILENMCKKFKLKFKFKHVLIELSIYFQGKIKFSH